MLQKKNSTAKLLIHFSALLRTLRYLQSDRGCEWDRAQSPHSLRKHLIEEAQELVEAINNNERENIIEECGDLLLVLLLIINSKKGQHTLSFTEVCRTLHKKLIRRHPHILGNRKTKRRIIRSNVDQDYYWKMAKQQEKQGQS